MIANFISDSVMQKFLRFAHAKFSNEFGSMPLFTISDLTADKANIE